MKHRAFAALVVLALAPWTTSTALTAEPAAAETPAAAQGRRVLDALTTGDDASFLTFIHQASPRSKLSDAEWLELRSHLRKLKFHGLLATTPTTADISVFDGERDSWARLLVTVEPEPPHAIATVGIRGARRPADVAPPPKLQPVELIAATKARLDVETTADKFSGAVLIAKDGKPIFTGAYGLADRQAHAPITPETQFRYGSMGKMFTAVSILQLAQAGKLDLTAPIGRYLADYPNKDIATKVTVENLLTHTGGTGDIFGPEFTAHRLSLREATDYVALFGARPPEFPPGSRVVYSNYGFILLGRIVEAASGLTYDDYVQRHIYGPAHMTATGMLPETVRLPRRAMGYTSEHGQLRSAADSQPYRGTPAGGGYSTVGDLLRFGNALTSGRLLDAEHLKRLTTGGIKGPDGTFYRYDFGGLTSEGLRFIGHAGGAPGMNGELRVFPDSGYTVIVLANRDPPIGTVIGSFISDRLP
ncbi:MAG: class beta-lactamase-related serine hydrolase [Phenylobacterium sp.]|nr:class beta-lactamase-related serine hydrolase [Phenylobacterium sp.]MDB5495893.1 class beta-lactamase-related serine hydrolase [Phenylobacterium sp.]